MQVYELYSLVQDIINKRFEKQHIEIKTAEKSMPRFLYGSLSSFSNQPGGGVIIFGLSEDNDYTVSGVFDIQELQRQVTNAGLNMTPPVRPYFTIVEIEGKFVVSAEILECDSTQKPCFYTPSGRLGGSFIRVGNKDLPMTEYEVHCYEVYKTKVRDELRTIERSSVSDLFADNVINYLLKLRQRKPLLSGQTDAKILQLQGLVYNGVPTIAGMMILGEYPQAYLPQLSITAVAVDGYEIGDLGFNGERFLDNQRMEGTIPQMLTGALSFVRRNMKNAVVVDADGKRADVTEYPIVALREVIMNALIHRDYSTYTEDAPIRIIMFKDRIEVENPGAIYGRLTVNDLGKVPGDTRNPFIAGCLEVLTETENRYSGIPTIYAEMKRAGLNPPVFESFRGHFKVTLYNSRVYDELATEGGITEERILAFCRTPRLIGEIAKQMGLSTSSYVKSTYIQPLLDMGKLELTDPDKPKSKYQKYHTV